MGMTLALWVLVGVSVFWSAGAAVCGHIISFDSGAGAYSAYGHP